MEHIKIEILGKYTKHAVLTADPGYCFYDSDEEEIQYTEKLFTPITDLVEITRKYIVVEGSAEELNNLIQTLPE